MNELHVQFGSDGEQMLGEQLKLLIPILKQEGHVPLKGLQAIEKIGFRRECWQHLLYCLEPMIEIFETFLNHRVVHAGAAILASSTRNKTYA